MYKKIRIELDYWHQSKDEILINEDTKKLDLKKVRIINIEINRNISNGIAYCIIHLQSKEPSETTKEKLFTKTEASIIYTILERNSRGYTTDVDSLDIYQDKMKSILVKFKKLMV